jgi:hypothetical protein
MLTSTFWYSIISSMPFISNFSCIFQILNLSLRITPITDLENIISGKYYYLLDCDPT